MTTTAPGEYVTLVNTGDTDISYMFQCSRYYIAPGARKTVPWGHFTHLMGNPFLTNADQNKDRSSEWKRLVTLYGPGGGEKAFPSLEAFDADGDRLFGVVEDRDGTNAPRPGSDDPMDPAVIRAQMAQMTRRQQALEELLRVHERATPNADLPTTQEDPAPAVAVEPRPDIKGIEPVDVIPTVPEDKPTKTPVATRGKA